MRWLIWMLLLSTTVWSNDFNFFTKKHCRNQFGMPFPKSSLGLSQNSRLLVGILVEYETGPETTEETLYLTDYIGPGHMYLVSLAKSFPGFLKYLWGGEILLTEDPGVLEHLMLRKANEISGFLHSPEFQDNNRLPFVNSVRNLQRFLEKHFPKFVNAQSEFLPFNEATPPYLLPYLEAANPVKPNRHGLSEVVLEYEWLVRCQGRIAQDPSQELLSTPKNLLTISELSYRHALDLNNHSLQNNVLRFSEWLVGGMYDNHYVQPPEVRGAFQEFYRSFYESFDNDEPRFQILEPGSYTFPEEHGVN